MQRFFRRHNFYHDSTETWKNNKILLTAKEIEQYLRLYVYTVSQKTVPLYICS